MFGAIVRAIGKATIPQVDPRGFVPGALGGGRSTGDEDVFGDTNDGFPENDNEVPVFPGFGDTESTEVPVDEENPFGDF